MHFPLTFYIYIFLYNIMIPNYKRTYVNSDHIEK